MIVRAVINSWNPYTLLPEAPDDEFEPEIQKVTESLKQCLTIDDLARSIQLIFENSFGEPFKYERCLKIAQEIWIRRGDM